jgi:hypothetical protein
LRSKSRKNRHSFSISGTASRYDFPEACGGELSSGADRWVRGGAQIYRVLVRRKPEPTYIELREDQLELAPTKI